MLNVLAKHSSSRTSIDTCLVLCYHRVGQLCYDPLQWTVEPYKFESQMEYLANNCNVISMDQMREHIETATPFKQRTVVVTFDGGYADILYTSREVLDKYQVFATVFSTSANITRQGQFWWDTLEDYFIANCVPGELEIGMAGRILKWPLRTQLDKFRAYYDLYSILMDATPSQQWGIINQITENIDLDAEELDDHRTMDARELKELSESDFITIGGHTHSGVKLSSLAQWQQVEEVAKNKDILEEVLGHEIEYFSYPFGSDDSCACAEIFRILNHSRFSLACGNSYSTVNVMALTSCYDLPRVRVGNWNLVTFHTFLERFLG